MVPYRRSNTRVLFFFLCLHWGHSEKAAQTNIPFHSKLKSKRCYTIWSSCPQSLNSDLNLLWFSLTLKRLQPHPPTCNSINILGMLSPSDLCFSSAWNTLFSNVCIIHFHRQMSPSHWHHPMKNLVPPSYTHILPPTSVQVTCSVMSDSLQPHGLQHARLPCPSPTPRACSNSCLLSQWCHPTISSSVGGPLILLRSIFPSIRVFSSESLLHIRRPKYWNFCFSIIIVS